MNNKITIKPYAPNIGATITGIDLSKEISNSELKIIKDAFHKFLVIFFQEQFEISPENHIKLGKCFGDLHIHPAAPKMKNFPEIFEIHTDKNSKISNGAEDFHSDVSCDIKPPLGTMLQLHILPESGGDTMFANMYMAYDALSNPMKQFLDKLNASHESEHFYKGRYSKIDENIKYPSAIHPVVRTHPETGNKILFVNWTYTKQIIGLEKKESDEILKKIFDHQARLELTCRYTWSENTVSIWDNRSVIHYAIADFFPGRGLGYERVMDRIAIEGDHPQ